MANRVSVINPSYCVPHPVSIQINTEKGVAYNEKDDRLFYINDILFSLHDRRVLYDYSNKPIVTFYNKSSKVCKVFKGESSDSSQFLFRVKKMKKSSTIPSGITKLNVFLANNQDEEKSDFRVIIYESKRSCSVYAGESSTIVAQMENNGGFNVMVNPNVDYAFIVALLMIVKDTESSYTEEMDAVSAIRMISSILSLG
ncbi:protein LURP-one-related 15-like [Vigna radiata var. radiata]|uniref:Protein LURP-one-related 15-like n=1 Tax=Vigna radiata var. radiata TaxID=3916 RepID=A0A1S3TUM4_VIGRR|nr:protein LURP-one-related 15-like [Vigna radiata var. radiata]